MLDRRQIMKASLAASALPFAIRGARAQGKPPVKVRFTEVVHSILYTPAYVALAKGFFIEAGLDVSMTTAQGGDKVVAALIGGAADIALSGPESAVFIERSESPTKARIFCSLTATDGYILMGREKSAQFDWSALKGKEIMGWRPGSTPLLFLEAALRKNGLDPRNDVKLVNGVAIPARVGAWTAGQTQFAIFGEPDAAQLEQDGKAHALASVGETVGFVDYTVFMATDRYIRENPAVVQAWTNAIARAQKWTATAATEDIVRILAQFFPGVGGQAMTAGVERYRRLGIWKASPGIEPAALEKFQDIYVAGQVLEADKRVNAQTLLLPDFAIKAG